MKLAEIVQAHRNDILRLTQKYGASHVRIFGSTVHRQDNDQSDLDLLVRFEPERSLLDHIALIQDLEELLGRKVDVVNEKALHWYIRERVFNKAKPL